MIDNPFAVILRRLDHQDFLINQVLKNTSSPVQSNPDNWLNLEELCNYLPEKPAKQTVYSWVSNKTIPVHKKGKKIFFLKSEIDEWLKSGRKKTIQEIESDAVKSIGVKSKKG